MSIKIEKITKDKVEEVIYFLTKEVINVYLEVRPQFKKIYNQENYDFINSFFFESFMEDINENSNIYIALLEDKIIGAGFIDDNNYLNSLFIKKEYQNMGIGSNILNNLIVSCSKNSIIRVDAKIDAISFYEKFNFHLLEESDERNFVLMELERDTYGK